MKKHPLLIKESHLGCIKWYWVTEPTESNVNKKKKRKEKKGKSQKKMSRKESNDQLGNCRFI